MFRFIGSLVRAYANIADDLPQAGYTDTQIVGLKHDIKRNLKLREIIRQSSHRWPDLKAYEADTQRLSQPVTLSQAQTNGCHHGKRGRNCGGQPHATQNCTGTLTR